MSQSIIDLLEMIQSNATDRKPFTPPLSDFLSQPVGHHRPVG